MITICIASCGDDRWRELAWSRAYPSASNQGAEVIIVHEPAGTVASVRNKAAEEAHGEWLVFLDADDELAPGYIEAMHQSLNGPAMYVPQVQYIRTSTRYAPKYWPEVSLRDGNWLVIGTMVPRQQFLDIGGFTEGVHLYEDWMLFAQLWKSGIEPVKVPDAIYIAHVQQRSRNRVANEPERLYWHQWIGHSVFPEHYDATTTDEDAVQRLISQDGRPPRFLRFR